MELFPCFIKGRHKARGAVANAAPFLLKTPTFTNVMLYLEPERYALRGYPVYRLQGAEGEVFRVGSIIEFRKSRRSMNRISLIRLAQKVFAGGPSDVVFVGSEVLFERREAETGAGVDQAAG